MKGKQHDGIKHTAKIMTAMELYPHFFFIYHRINKPFRELSK